MLHNRWIKKCIYCVLAILLFFLFYIQTDKKIAEKEIIRYITPLHTQETLDYFQNTTTTETKHEESSADPLHVWKNWSIPVNSMKSHGGLNYTQFTVEPFIWKRPSLVCLSTQVTANRIHEMLETLSNWQGRMSISVYVPGREFVKTKIILWLLHQCLKGSASELVFHFAYRQANQPIDDEALWNEITSKTCKDLKSIGDFLKVTNEHRQYPQNAMRNIAREECNSEYVILADNDMAPNPGLANALEPFLLQQRSCEKCAFVIPVYECNVKIAILPTNKDELIEAVNNGSARPFHWQNWKPNQGSHYPKTWETITHNTGVQIAYPITKYELYYEPIYVARKPVPLFDSRFIGYGFVRSSQMLEMVAAGYRFYLLDNAFLLHRGMKLSRYSPKTRSREMGRNSGRFIQFAKEVLRRYGRHDIVTKMERGSPFDVLSNYSQDIYQKNIQ